MADNNGANSIPFANGVKHAVKVPFCSMIIIIFIVVIFTPNCKLPLKLFVEVRFFHFQLNVEVSICVQHTLFHHTPYIKYNVINDVSIRYYFNSERTAHCYAFQIFAREM